MGLQFPPYLWPADGAASASRSLQLSGWLRELAGRLVSSKEGVVLSRSWKGMPESRRWLRDIVRTLRLWCWIRELDGGLERAQEVVVLHEQGEGLPTSCWRMRVSSHDGLSMVSALGPSSGATEGDTCRSFGRDFSAGSRHLRALNISH